MEFPVVCVILSIAVIIIVIISHASFAWISLNLVVKLHTAPTFLLSEKAVKGVFLAGAVLKGGGEAPRPLSCEDPLFLLVRWRWRLSPSESSLQS
jgi:hypothetical protein